MIHRRTLESLEFPEIIECLASKCQSEAAKTLAYATKPYNNRQEAEKALRLLDESRIWAASSEYQQISPFPDLSGILAKLLKKRGPSGLPPAFSLDVESFWAVRETLRMASRVIDGLRSNLSAAAAWPALLARAEEAPMPVQLLAALNRCLSDDGFLKDESSPELFRLRGELRKLHQGCLKKVRDYAQQYNMLSYLQDEFMTLSSDRYVLPLKANFKGRMQGIIHDWSQTGETCYFEPYFLVEINNRLQELKHEEREEERRILVYLTSLLDSEYDGVVSGVDLLAELDFLQAVRDFANDVGGEIIGFCESGDGIELNGARHPLLVLSRLQDPAKPPVRPVDIVLRPGEKALIITGGNAGGKTVCLKCLGLLSAMSMSGLPVPAARGSRLPWFDRIDAFIGDEQSLSENMSTFSAQIDHLAKAFGHLNEGSLAILDEFGAGTDPAEGSALAQATHDGLMDKGCFVLSATHFPALKTYALTKNGARAATMLFDPATNRPLFKLAYDQVGASQALAVAAEHGLPEAILARARHYLLQDGEDSGALLARLNELATIRESEIDKLRCQQEKASHILEEQRAKLDQQKKRLQADVQEHIRQLMAAWKADKISARQAMKEISGLRAELGLPDAPANESVLPVLENISPGMRVLHAGFNKSGVVKDVDERRKRARIDLDGVSLWAELRDLRSPGAGAIPRRVMPAASVPGRGPAPVLDVRGKRASEAIPEVEKFIDNAILAGSSELEIVHGRGTGALRREIHNFLRSFPAVSDIALAPEDRGGDGMTIVTLR